LTAESQFLTITEPEVRLLSSKKMENKGLVSHGISQSINQRVIHMKSILLQENSRRAIYEFKLLYGVPFPAVTGHCKSLSLLHIIQYKTKMLACAQGQVERSAAKPI
jgi:hypothetical protein